MIPIEYDIISNFSDDILIISKQLERRISGLIDKKTMQEILPCKYIISNLEIDKLASIIYPSVSLYKLGLFDINTKNIIIPCHYEDIDIFNNVIRVMNDDKFGLFDKLGNQIVDCIYDKIKVGYDMIVLYKDSKQGIIFMNNDSQYSVINPDYDEIIKKI